MPLWLYVTLSALGFSALIGAELRARGFRAGLHGKKRRRILRNFQFLAGALTASIALRLIWSQLFVHVSPIVEWGARPIANLIGCVLVAELIGYGLHYVKHKSSLLWKFHFQHHIEPRYDIWLVTHTHALEVMISGTAMGLALVALGFTPSSVEAYLLFYGLANTYQHSAFDYSLGWLDRIIVNPAYHRFHHAVGSDTNFGNTLTVWDVVFRTATWPKSRHRPNLEIGIGPGPEPYGFVEEMLYFTEPSASPSYGPEPTTATIPVYVP